ncbi:hypothetical protein COCNU_02G013500 [Cocos nucifera]|uniref:MIF4G domain-containing protein n=1 Tax=Cocos nucifera TaxID=13894 RepID=A0A8K0I0I5_COCNU|nr:hypothetical protein COCNU_02G013500 [Cocos nucifera]
MQILGKFFSTVAAVALALSGTPSTADLFLHVVNSGGGSNASSSGDKALLLPPAISFGPSAMKASLREPRFLRNAPDRRWRSFGCGGGVALVFLSILFQSNLCPREEHERERVWGGRRKERREPSLLLIECDATVSFLISVQREMEHPEDECRMVGEHHGKQDDEDSAACLDEYKKSIDAKLALRHINLNPERPDSGFLRTLDSSIKRNTAVIKKLKQINDEQREGLMDELRSVNLSKFVSEAAAAISDAKLRTSDIQAAVQVCSLLHQRYKDFSPCFIQGLLKVFFPGKCGDDLDTDKNMRAIKKRSTLKLLMELYFVGVVDDVCIFVNIIKDLTSLDHLRDRDVTQTNLSLLTSFARQGRYFLGLYQPGQEVHDEFFKGLNVTADQKKFFKKAFHSYYDAVAELIQSEHNPDYTFICYFILYTCFLLVDTTLASFLNLEEIILPNNGSVLVNLAEALDMQPPVMPDDRHTTRVTTSVEVSSSASGKESSLLEPVWDDEDTRAFYESLPDLRAFVPSVLLGEAEPKVNEQHPKIPEQQSVRMKGLNITVYMIPICLLASLQ